MRLRLALAATLTSFAFAMVEPACAEVADRPLEAIIDQSIDEAIATASVSPAPQADDATLIRRLTLDLVGRIPTASEVNDFTNSKESQKRAKLIERLLTSSGFARHQAAQFEVMFSPDGERRGSGAIRDYLVGALKDGKPWDKIFRELMLPDETDAKQKGAADYLRPRLTDGDKLANDVSVAFFGVNVIVPSATTIRS